MSATPIPVEGGQAPDFVGIASWINSPALTLKDLHGTVVLIDFWTYSCINCVRTLPHLKQWYAAYRDKGFTIIGIHTPEFEFEKNLKNVQDAVTRFDIHYPVALDNEYMTWNNYHNRYWPAHYLIDQEGIIRYIHFGEGEYQKTENAIRTLLGLAPVSAQEEHAISRKQTPETYLGYMRASAYTSDLALKNKQTADYTYTSTLADNQVGLKGPWLVAAEYIQSKGDTAQLDLNFIADHVYLVMAAQQPSPVTVLLDNKPVPTPYRTKDTNEQGKIIVSASRMYDIIDLKGDNGPHLLTLHVPPEVSLYAFTFGN